MVICWIFNVFFKSFFSKRTQNLLMSSFEIIAPKNVSNSLFCHQKKSRNVQNQHESMIVIYQNPLLNYQWQANPIMITLLTSQVRSLRFHLHNVSFCNIWRTKIDFSLVKNNTSSVWHFPFTLGSFRSRD